MRRTAVQLIVAPGFQYTIGVIILLNVVIMIMETDSSVDEEDSRGGPPAWMEICSWVALVVFVLELSLRLFALRSFFWKDAWNTLDFWIATADVFFSLIGYIVGDIFPLSMLRLFRLAKLARVSKLFRVFPELRVLMAGLTGSARAIFWGMVLLIFVLLVWSMVAVLFIHPLAKNLDFDGCTRCPQAYNSVARAMLTFWQQVVAADSWGEATMPLIEAHPSTALFFIPMFMMVAMAVMNLILGVVVDVALTAKALIEDEDTLEMKLERMETQTHLMDLCQQLDVNHDGNVSKEEAFQKYKEPGEFRDKVLALDVTEDDFNIIWTIVDADKKGKVPYKELISRLYSLRSSDSQFMLSYIKYYITLIRNDLLDTMRHTTELVSEMRHVEADVQHMANHAEAGRNDLLDTMRVAASHVEADMQYLERDVHSLEKDMHELGDDLRKKKRRQEENLEIKKQFHEPNLEAWQSLDDFLQKIPILRSHESGAAQASQELLPANFCAPIDTAQLERRIPEQAKICNSLSSPSTNATEAKAAWDKQVCHDIEALQVEFKHSLIDLAKCLKFQVSLVSTMNHKMSTKA